MDGFAPHLEVRAAPRRATVEDIPFLVELARLKYPGYSFEQGAEWGKAALALPNYAFFICGYSVGIVSYSVEFYRPTERASDLMELYGLPRERDPWASYRCLKACVDWALKDQGCYIFRFGSLIDDKGGPAGGVDRLGVFAQRLGAKPWGVTYALGV